ncbi:hypothetical protein [Tessaracoccus flavus]|uniref:Uncharacterized protein n=1 Tax=Tessaracoccus flavus TaxID=1610493 RepID=A0A1Q2CI88_9ACTN|nr:hypothetical protein [Tessaracoccus flavus]AQP45827.1 hypothetical protein RPIT_14275 [Tessaracoccus flavus]SDZ14900.1 hypothetical protein SAMN05428934_11237 [Tessaracoccus flavus]
MKFRLAAAAVAALALVGLSACSPDDAQPDATATVSAPAEGTSQPTDPGAGDATEPGGVQTQDDGTITFEGDVQTETIMVGPQEIEVPKGIKLPEESLVSDAQPAYVMIIDEDPSAVITAVTESAEESGYEVFAQPNEYTWVFVGHGNAVLLSASPQVQILSWGPEAMAEVLAEA